MVLRVPPSLATESTSKPRPPRLRRHVLCLDTLNSREWAAALQAVAGSNRHLSEEPVKARRERIGRYKQLQNKFTDQLQKDLVAILN